MFPRYPGNAWVLEPTPTLYRPRCYDNSTLTVSGPSSEHDVVVLREPVGGWPVGTTGTVVSVYDGAVLVEIIGPGGKTLEMIQARTARLDIKHA